MGMKRPKTWFLNFGIFSRAGNQERTIHGDQTTSPLLGGIKNRLPHLDVRDGF